MKSTQDLRICLEIQIQGSFAALRMKVLEHFSPTPSAPLLLGRLIVLVPRFPRSGCRGSSGNNDFTQDFQGAFTSGTIHIQVGDHANALRVRGVCQDALCSQELRNFVTLSTLSRKHQRTGYW